MNTKTITAIITVAAICGLVIWDLIVNFNKIAGDTVSEMAGSVFRSTPILAVVLGVIVGHLCSNFVGIKPVVQFIGERPIIALMTGIPIGFLFWSMER